MDKSAIKNFAVGARVKLKDQIEQKAYTFGITKNEIKKVEMFEDAFEVNGNKYNKKLLKHRESLVKKINEKGFEQVLEEVAYTWFNRLIAIRFMEVNEYLPSGVRVLSSININKVEPDIISEAANLDFENLNIDLIYKLQDENNAEELFKYLLIKQCNELGKIMPVVFEEIEDFTELLLPENLLQEGSIIRDLVTSIIEDDWKEQVEIIGWLYQYYISEKKDEVFEALKKNVKITKENIPAATQLFTPDWIVKYMVENSLGRLWLESHPDDELKTKWKYYLEEAEQEQEVMNQLQIIRGNNKDLKPEDIKFLDCCMGSGHILVYAFDVFYDIYKSAGYSEREISKLILEKNLYGLDIDNRAAQLAYFAVMMKAKSYNRRIFREKIDLNICAIQESNDFPEEAIDYLVNSKETEIEKRLHREDVEYLINVFNDAKEYGSILEVKEIDFKAIERRIEEIKSGDTADIFELQYKNIILEMIPQLINQAKILSRKYNAVITNPPYMGNGGMNNTLSEYIKRNYPNSKSDLSTVFMERCTLFSKENGYFGMINIPTWMFLGSYENLRKELISQACFINLLHLGRGIFGSDFGTTAFIIQNRNGMNYTGLYKRLFDKQGSVDNIDKKEKMFFEKERDYSIVQRNLNVISGFPIAYWVSDNDLSVFKNNIKLGEMASPRQGLATGENNRFLRFWYEVDINRAGFGYKSRSEANLSGKKWFPYNKGGEFRKWYGNSYYLVNWCNDGHEIRNFKDEKGKLRSRPQNMDYYFSESITWSKVTIGGFSTRYEPLGFLFDVAGCSIFLEKENLKYVLGLTNSKVTQRVLSFLSPTINYEVGHIANIPIIYSDKKEIIIKLVEENIVIAKDDWNSNEISWDFTVHPLLMSNLGRGIEQACIRNDELIQLTRNELKRNEERINELFIKIYGLENELIEEINDKDITIRKIDTNRDIRSFISYGIGCIFGRYSLDDEGLIYAGGEFKLEKYNTFKVDVDNVIPITDDEYFEDDIISRFVEFVKITFNEETLEENLDYIAETLGKKGDETSRQTIRRYFLKDFYKDHLQTYQKKPIYWLFDSGKNDGFKALVYMHRYDIGTVARVRTDYLHLLQRKYEAETNRLDMVMENSNESIREKSEAKKKKEKIQKQILECVQYDQVIAHVANQKVSIDLDDGVSVNYAKFQGIEVPQGEGKKPLKADLLAKI
jgi:type II restriction/modification system DNA methylase subunit YeeA